MKRRDGLSGPQGGFTLVELLLVVVIIGILAAMVIPGLAGKAEQARISKAESDVASLVGALLRYNMDVGKYPTTDEWNAAPSCLLVAPADATALKKWQGPYLEMREIPLDPWGNPYVYEFPGRIDSKTFDLSSNGPNGTPGDDDDIKRK